jgi:hypothetical protein
MQPLSGYNSGKVITTVDFSCSLVQDPLGDRLIAKLSTPSTQKVLELAAGLLHKLSLTIVVEEGRLEVSLDPQRVERKPLPALSSVRHLKQVALEEGLLSFVNATPWAVYGSPLPDIFSVTLRSSLIPSPMHNETIEDYCSHLTKGKVPLFVLVDTLSQKILDSKEAPLSSNDQGTIKIVSQVQETGQRLLIVQTKPIDFITIVEWLYKLYPSSDFLICPFVPLDLLLPLQVVIIKKSDILSTDLVDGFAKSFGTPELDCPDQISTTLAIFQSETEAKQQSRSRFQKTIEAYMEAGHRCNSDTLLGCFIKKIGYDFTQTQNSYRITAESYTHKMKEIKRKKDHAGIGMFSYRSPFLSQGRRKMNLPLTDPRVIALLKAQFSVNTRDFTDTKEQELKKADLGVVAVETVFILAERI